MNVCGYCGNIEENPGKYCTKCGKLFRQPSFCIRCGAPLKSENKFCNRCGEPVGEGIKNTIVPTVTNEEAPISEEQDILGQQGPQENDRQPVSDVDENVDGPVDGRKENNEEEAVDNHILPKYAENDPQEDSLSGEDYQAPSSNKAKIWIGIIAAAIIIGGGIWGYNAYVENTVEKETTTTDQHTPLAIIKESGSETLRLFDLDGQPFGPTIDWEMDWPEGGEASIRNKIKADIIKMLDLEIPNGKTVDDVTPQELFQETVKQRYKSEYEHIKTPAQYQETSSVFWCDGEECKATIEIWDDALVNITTMSTPNIMNGAPYTQTSNELILLETGEAWTPSLLPSDSQLLPLVIKQWVRRGYPQEAVSKAGKELLEADSRYWTKDGLTFFYWKPWGLNIPDVDWMVEMTIPYRELLPVLSSNARRFIMPSILESVESTSTNDLSDKLIYSLFFVEKGEWGYNAGLQKKFKQYGITGPLSYSIFSKDLTALKNNAQNAYKEWQTRNQNKIVDMYLDFPDTESNVLRSYFEEHETSSPFDITIMEIKKLSDAKAEVLVLCDDIEFMMEDEEGVYRSAWEYGYGSPEQKTKRISLVKENGQWKVDNVILELNYDGELQEIDWKKDLKSFISNPTKFMPYLIL